MRLNGNDIVQGILFLLTLILFGMCQNVHGQDSTFSHFKQIAITDSVVVNGDNGTFDRIDSNSHLEWTGIISGSHQWAIQNKERVCYICQRYEIFHYDSIPVYNYSRFYLAKQKALKLLQKGK